MSAPLADLLADVSERETGVHLEFASDPAGAAVLTIAAPRLNAMTLDIWRAIPGRLAEARDASVVVLRGAGDRALSAGADIGEFAELRTTARAALVYSSSIGAAIDAIRTHPVPVIAMIRGLAVGGGCEIAASCDARIASDDARLGIPIGKLGVTLGLSEAAALIDVLGPARARWLVLSGRLVDAADALRIGLVDEVADGASLVAATAQLATTIAESSAVTVRATKKVIRTASAGATRAAAEAFAAELFDAYEGPDLQAGVTAFLDRRSSHGSRKEQN